MARRCRQAGIPLVIFREDGVEPLRDAKGAPHLAAALAHLRALYALTRDAALVAPGRALASLAECGDPSPAEVVDGLLYAADGSRWAAWIEPVVETVRA